MNADDGIAIIGMSGRFPGARDVSTFWQNVKNGVESISHFSEEELEIPMPASDAGGGNSSFVRARGILDDVDKFDAQFFGYLPREVEMMDPQHRVFLELCWEAIEHAGYDPARYAGAIGVYGGCYMNTYFMWNLSSNPQLLAHLVETIQVGSLQAQLGNDKDYLATRVAFKLGLRGPAMTVQSACSTALVSVATACQSLNARQCDMALAGAAAIVLPQKKGYFYKEGSIFSPDGHCRTFDELAGGTVFSNAAAVVLLKRVASAIADGDTIYAVIRGYALNNNGAAPPSFTAPSAEGQTEVISRAMTMAGINARTVGYVEAHGTATALGDPIEVAGLTAAYRTDTADAGYCAIGSVKANLGHLDVASGTIGLIKAALSVQEGVLAPSINFTKPNPRIDFASSPFYVNTQLRPWPAADWPRRAAVTALGIGGTNAHVVLEQAPPPAPTGPQRRCSLLVLSARSEAALAMQCQRLAAFMDGNPSASLEDVAYTLQVGRREFECRRIVVATDCADAAVKLRAAALPGETLRARTSRPAVVFMFPGQGTQYPGMARELYQSEPVFRDVIDRCCDALAGDREHPLDMRPYLLWDPVDSPMDLPHASAELAQTRLAQPAIFAVEMALARLFESWGVRPAAVMGHSVGEFAAACIAGVLDLADAVRLVATRGRLMQAQPPGTMLAVRASADRLEPMLPAGVAIAAINAPELTVVSGPGEVVASFGARLAQQDIQSSPLVTSHAYHSQMMAPARQPLVDAVSAVQRKPAAIAVVSTALARAVAEGELSDPEYWGEQMMSPVRFADSVTAAATNDDRILLEVGPGQTLSTLSRQVLRASAGRIIVSSLGGSQASGSSMESVLAALGKLWVAGLTPDWAAFQAGARLRVALPTYPFERKRFWIEPTPFEADPRYRASAAAPAVKADMSQSAKSGSAGTPSEPQADQEGDLPRQGSVSPVQAAGSATGHAGRILGRLLNKMHALSGLSVDELRGGATFIELGFDSLFMTQVCRAIEVEFGVPITLRQLADELSSIPRLADHLATALAETSDASPGRSPVVPTRPVEARTKGPIVREARFEEKELEGVLRVLRQAFPSFYGSCSLADFLREQHHKWMANPARTPDHVYGWVLETHDEGIVGFVALLPVRIKIGDREVAAGAGCSLAVLPAFRNYSLLLSKQLMDWGDRHFYITTTANEISNGLNRALGLHTLPIKDFSHQLLWLLRPEATVQLAISRSAWSPLQGLTARWPGSALLKGIARLWFINHRQVRFNGPRLPVERVESFGEEFDDLWEKNKKDFDITTVRQRTFLNWRHFGNGSLVGQTFVFACRDGGELRGYVAVQARSPEAGYLPGHYVVTDLFYERERKDVLHNLMNHAFDFVSAHGGSVFQVSGYSTDVIEELKTQRPRIRRDRPDPYWYQGGSDFDQVLGDARRWWPSGADGDSNL